MLATGSINFDPQSEPTFDNVTIQRLTPTVTTHEVVEDDGDIESFHTANEGEDDMASNADTFSDEDVDALTNLAYGEISEEEAVSKVPGIVEAVVALTTHALSLAVAILENTS